MWYLYALTRPRSTPCEESPEYKSYLTHGHDHYLSCGPVSFSNYSCSYSTDSLSYSEDILETRRILESCESLGFSEKTLRKGYTTQYKCYYISPTEEKKYSNDTQTRCGMTIYNNVTNLGFNLDSDTVSPSVSSTSPQDETTPISKLNPVYIKFSERMNEDSLISENVLLELSGVSVSVIIIKGKDYINVFPSPITDNWTTGQVYTLTILNGPEDFFGNQMDSSYTFQFEAQ